MANLETYHGLLLLPVDAQIPESVQTSPGIVLHDAEASGEFTGETLIISSVEGVSRTLGFPIPNVEKLPAGFEFAGAQVIRYVESGEIYLAWISFGPQNPESREIEPRLVLYIQPKHNQPHPIWAVRSSQNEDQVIQPEKVTFTPEPGVLLPSANGFDIYWIKDGVLYRLLIDYPSNREAAETIVRSLA